MINTIILENMEQTINQIFHKENFQQEQEQVVLVLVPQLYFLELVILKILQTGQEQLIQLLNVM